MSDIECRRRKYTYTYDTLIELRRTAAADEEFDWIIEPIRLQMFSAGTAAPTFSACVRLPP